MVCISMTDLFPHSSPYFHPHFVRHTFLLIMPPAHDDAWNVETDQAAEHETKLKQVYVPDYSKNGE